MSTILKKTFALLLGIMTLVVGAAVFVAMLSAAPAAEEKQLSIYAPVATYTLPVLDRSGHEYVGLLELLEPLGRVSSQTSGARWNIRYNAVDGSFAAGKSRCRIHGRDFELGAPFLIENARGFVPLASIGNLLPRFLGTAVDFHHTGRRLLIGDIGIQPSFQIESGPQPKLILNFTAAVNPTISTEPGRVRMVFKRDPIVNPGSQLISFTDKVITQASYAESNGVAEIDVLTARPLLATFSNAGKTITLATAPAANVTSGAGSAGTGSAGSSAAKSPATANAPVIRRPVVFVDAAHGGEERGAALTDSLAEKDVTLGFARLLRYELDQRGFAVQMSREGDNSLPFDQRAGLANSGQAILFISLHAVSQGSGARVYTALLPWQGASKGAFRAWDAAQAPVLGESSAVAAAMVTELQRRKMTAGASAASLRPLNNVIMPAVAVELGPGPNGVSDLGSASYQKQVAAAIADAVVSVRDQLEVQR